MHSKTEYCPVPPYSIWQKTTRVFCVLTNTADIIAQFFLMKNNTLIVRLKFNVKHKCISRAFFFHWVSCRHIILFWFGTDMLYIKAEFAYIWISTSAQMTGRLLSNDCIEKSSHSIKIYNWLTLGSNIIKDGWHS